MGRIARLSCAAGLMLLSTGCKSTFACTDDTQCNASGQAGICQPATGFCSFAADDCESGQKYGTLAPEGLAGTCVPVGGGSTSGATPTTGDDATPPMPATTSGGPAVVDSSSGPAATTEGSSGEVGSSSDSGDPPGSSSGGLQPGCCVPGCDGTCPGGGCDPMLLGGPVAMAEAIGVAIVDDVVIWSTGFGRTLEMYGIQTGDWSQLAAVDDNQFVTKIAASKDHVYFLDYGNGWVKRASVPGGAVEVVADVGGGEAGFGAIAVNDTHVYFAMGNTGDVWRATLQPGNDPVFVAEVDAPRDVALDDEYVYFVEALGLDEVRRIALDEVGMDTTGTMVVSEGGIAAIAIDGDRIYYVHDGTLSRALKTGSNNEVEDIAGNLGGVWEIDVDEEHVYLTSETDDALVRVSKADETIEHLAESETPWGLAVGCEAVYWAQNGTQELFSLPK